MKLPLLFSLTAIAMLPSSAETIRSKPMGMVKITSKKDSDLPFSIPLDRRPDYAGSALRVSGNEITVSGTPFTASQFVYAAGSQPNTYFMLVRSGTLEGRIYDLVSNTTTSFTVNPNHPSNDLSAQGLQATDKICVVPYWTLGTLFPNGEGVPASTDPFNPTGLVLVRNADEAGIRRAPSKAFLYYNDTTGDADGWYDSGNLGGGLVNDLPLTREAFYVLRNLGMGDTSVSFLGDVPVVPFTTEVGNIESGPAQDSYLGSPYPVEMALGESGLITSGAFRVSSDPFAPTDLLLTYDYAAIADLRPAPSKAYLYHENPTDSSVNGWYDASNLGAGVVDAQTIFKPAQSYIIRSAAGTAGTTTWKAPVPYPVTNP